MKRILARVGICFLSSLLCIAIIFFSGVAMINYGPSPSARGLFVNTVLETSAAKFLATWFFSEERLAEIVQSNNVQEDEGITDSSLIRVEPNTNFSAIEADKDNPFSSYIDLDDLESNNGASSDASEKDIEIFDVKGATYKGKMMIIKDPSRVFVGVSGEYGEGKDGKNVAALVKKYDAAAGVNGGGFEDTGGLGTGGIPMGIVFSEGQLLWGESGVKSNIIGFTNDNVLIVGKMTPEQAMEAGVRDAVSFGPVLIKDGKASTISGSGGGLNPRTAIGQRRDGAVLLLVIDGRQTSSLGANYGDIIEVMLSYGAVNAANLDGGNSTCMHYNGEYINSTSYYIRMIPTGILVRK